MLKTLREKKLWLVSQPDHAEVSGFLAYHWGNDEFTRPGHFNNSVDSEKLWAETVLAITQHDNGWWEWEATPDVSEDDGLPMGLSEVLRNQQDGINRWRLGIPRFSRDHPYVSLLTSFHAYWLYSHGSQTDQDPAFDHPLFWKGSSTYLMEEKQEKARAFVSEIKEIQNKLFARLRSDPDCTSWIETEQLNPHVRLLQLLDGLSLSLCASLIPPHTGKAKGLGDDAFALKDVPRQGWDDRVTIEIKPKGERRIICEPYPFDVDPLPVIVPARIIDWPAVPLPRFQSWLYSKHKQPIRFEYCSS